MKPSVIITKYIEESLLCLNELKNLSPEIERIASIINNSKKNNQNIFLCGNGGSGSTASHFFCDFNKTASMEGKKRLKEKSD